MTLLLSQQALRARVAVASGSLAPLADGLAAELAPLESADLYVPREKALLSREGGRCPRDGATLEFDPFSPHRHRCAQCGTVNTGALHDRFWIFWYQLWLAERAVHGALLANLRGDAEAGALAERILRRYADEYLSYPNRDNVLGPTRLFFSTYLESIWLLNISIALDLLESHSTSDPTLGSRVRDGIIEPAAGIIAEYDEGSSNRQVWNDAALIAANHLIDRPDRVEQATFGRSGVTHHLEHGLLPDGTWFEGENYHLFAHRGLWYSLTMLDALGWSLPAPLVGRFQEGFATPFLTALPDMTLPSRRDSQYAISLRQPRFAELCELGLAREEGAGDPRLRAALHRLYEDAVPRGDTGRARSTADVERNLPATKLSRADLGWRSLLFARPDLPALDSAPLGSVLLEAQGIAVFRREQERIYVALDYGTSGGGHGHPDRLNVLLSDGSTRWLDDMGTGSYVDPSLHWYRSTLAHNAPMFDGREQRRVDGELLAFEEGARAGWASARAEGLYPGVVTSRTLVVMPDYVLDELQWRGEEPVIMDLPMHIDPATCTLAGAMPPEPGVNAGPIEYALEDTLGVLEIHSSHRLQPRTAVHVSVRDGERLLNGIVLASAAATLYQVTGPGAPGKPRKRFLLFRIAPPIASGWIRVVWNWTAVLEKMSTDPSGRVALIQHTGGTHDRHWRTKDGWRVQRLADQGGESIKLGGVVRRRVHEPEPASERPIMAVLHVKREQTFDLGARTYRRSEESWQDAGSPSAAVTIRAENEALVIDIAVRKAGPLTFVPPTATNPYDNEAPDVNGDGIQLYLVDGRGASGWVLVPDALDRGEGNLRSRLIDGWTEDRLIEGSWQRTSDGYAVHVLLPLEASRGEFALGLVVNEKPPDRERRRGQLVLGGAPGEFVYLRGDREERDRLPRFRLSN
jgi:hypothetical protein